MKFQEVTDGNFNDWLEMGLELWPYYKSKREELEDEFRRELGSSRYKHFLVQGEDGDYMGFVNISLRDDYVQGSSSKPVGYVEGIYVRPRYRKQGIARELVNKAKEWVREQGCSQIGSDAELSNVTSQKFHESIGFRKTGVAVHYIMDIGE